MRPAQILLAALVGVPMVAGCARVGAATQAVAGSPSNAAPPPQVIPSGYPPAKASALAAEDRARLKNAGKPMVSASFAPIQGTLVRGIYVPGQDPQLRDEFSITNAWAGPGLGAWEAVDAGSVPLATGEGLTDHARDEAAVFVFTAPTDPNSAVPRTIIGIIKPSPGLRGQFTITRIDGTTLTLALSGSSTVYHFDTGTLRFS